MEEEVISADIDSKLYELYKDTPVGQVRLLAVKKAKEVIKKVNRGVVVAADTVVELEGEILGKPEDKEKAVNMLKKLSGRKHKVHTGVCIIRQNSNDENKIVDFAETTEVFMKNITDEEIANYVATGEPLDKAGAYGIQGRAAAFITKINGDYNNVVGLPISRLYDELKKLQ